MKEVDVGSMYIILVVEDDEGLNRLIQKRLAKAGLRTEHALNGAEAIIFVRENPNTVLLLDYLLPDMTGEELIKTLAGQERSVPFIVMTGHGDEKIAVEMMKLGARDYLMKGMTFLDPLPQVVRQVLNTLTTEKKLAETEATLLESEERLSSFMESSPAAFALFDSELNYVEINDVALRYLDRSKEDVIGENILDIVPMVKETGIYNSYLEVMKTGKSSLIEDLVRHTEFGDVHLAVRAFKVGNGLGLIATDITNRIKAEERIKSSLKEKEVMLKEIHHRVKNNLQVISSLFRLQSRYVKDKEALALFNDSQSRIRSMALIHEKLYQSKNLARIDFADYIRSLTGSLFRFYHINPDDIQLKIEFKDVFLDVNIGIPCGLIINELITNSLRHAFPDARKGEIKVELYEHKKGEFTLNVRDNGIGLPEGLDFRNTKSLGMELVISLVEQLGGRIALDRDEGTSFTIRF